MFRLIVFIALLAGLSWGGAWLLQNHGAVEVTWLGYEVRTTVAFALGVLFTGVLALLFMVQFVLWVFSLPERARGARTANRMDRAMLALTRGFAAIASADAKTAQSASREAQKLLAHHKQGSQLALILAAEAEQLDGNRIGAEAKFTALLADKSTEFLGLRGLMIEAQKAGDTEKAIGIAEKAYGLRPDGQGIARILLMLYRHAGRWADAEALLEHQARRARFRPGAGRELDLDKERAAIALAHAKTLEAASPDRALGYAKAALRHQPDLLPAAELAAKLALALHDTGYTRRVIERQWKKEPSEALGNSWLALEADAKPKQRVKHALKLLALQPEHPESQRIAAKAYLEAGENASALAHAKLALGKEETESLCKLMADIEDGIGDRAEAERWSERARHHAAPDSGYENSLSFLPGTSTRSAA